MTLPPRIAPDHLVLTAANDAQADGYRLQLDARRRQFIWPQKKMLTFDATMQRLQKQFPRFPRELIASHLTGWIEMGYVPHGYSEKEHEEFEQLTAEWVDELDAQL